MVEVSKITPPPEPNDTEIVDPPASEEEPKKYTVMSAIDLEHVQRMIRSSTTPEQIDSAVNHVVQVWKRRAMVSAQYIHLWGVIESLFPDYKKADYDE